MDQNKVNNVGRQFFSFFVGRQLKIRAQLFLWDGAGLPVSR